MTEMAMGQLLQRIKYLENELDKVKSNRDEWKEAAKRRGNMLDEVFEKLRRI